MRRSRPQLSSTQGPTVMRKQLETSVHRILRLCLGPEADIEALAHKVFARAARQMTTQREPRPLKQMVISATIAICTEEERRGLRRAPGPALPAHDIFAEAEPPDRAALILLLIETLEMSARGDFQGSAEESSLIDLGGGPPPVSGRIGRA